MIGALLFVAFAHGASVSTGPDPGLESGDVVEQFAAWAKKKKLKGPAAQLVCMPFADPLQLCFTKLTGEIRSYYTAADGKTAAELLALGVGDEEAAITPLEASYVDGFAQRYFLVTGQARAHTALLFPDALERKVGGKCVVGAPAEGVLVAWVPGDLDFDKVMAVGVKRMFDTLPNAVSPVLYTYDGRSWVQWGEATELVLPKGDPSPSP